MISRRSLALGGVLPFARAGHAQASYPSRYIRMVVPFAAGGPADLVARLVARGMGEDLGQSLVVENKVGAGSVLGADFVAKAPPDGYTILFATIAYTIASGLYRSLPYDPTKDLVPVGLIARAPLVLVVRPSLNVDTVASFTNLLKAEPGRYSYGSAGFGAVDHLSGAWFESLAQVRALHVPYNGTALSIQDLLAGRLDFLITTYSVVLPHIRSGAMRALAVTSAARMPGLPNVPTMAEVGMPEFQVSTWYSILVPSGVPSSIIGRLGQAIAAAVSDADVRRRFNELGVEISEDRSPEHLATFMAAEQRRWAQLLEASGVERQ